MESAIVSGLQGLFDGVTNLGSGQVIMLLIGSLLLYLGISKGYEPLLLVPIGFGALLVNIPLAGLMDDDGFLRFFYNAGVLTEVFPLLIFLGIGAMTDFQPPIMRLLTTDKERKIVMGVVKRPVSKTTKVVFPIMVTIAASIHAHKGTPLIGTLM